MGLPPSSSDFATASTALDDILCNLVAYIKRFKTPSELDFPSNSENALVLVNSEKNKPFINQLRSLDGLRTQWAKIPTLKNEQLEAKHKATGAAIGRALIRMKEFQLQLYEKHAKAYPARCMYIG